MRNKYSKEFEKEMIKLSQKKTLEELLKVARLKYNYNITKKQLQSYLSKRQIRYKGYNVNLLRNASNELPIGSERLKSDGMVQIKVSKNKWEYKQRYIYEQYHNVKLTYDDFIIFLDQDRTNFDISNLKRVSRRESSIVANQGLFFNEPTLTTTGIEVAKLIIKAKKKKKGIII